MLDAFAASWNEQALTEPTSRFGLYGNPKRLENALLEKHCSCACVLPIRGVEVGFAVRRYHCITDDDVLAAEDREQVT